MGVVDKAPTQSWPSVSFFISQSAIDAYHNLQACLSAVAEAWHARQSASEVVVFPRHFRPPVASGAIEAAASTAEAMENNTTKRNKVDMIRDEVELKEPENAPEIILIFLAHTAQEAR